MCVMCVSVCPIIVRRNVIERRVTYHMEYFILVWPTQLDPALRTLFVCVCVCKLPKTMSLVAILILTSKKIPQGCQAGISRILSQEWSKMTDQP